MCNSKIKGGMGFKDFATQNSALLAKQAWRRLQSCNDYWAIMLRSIYCERVGFWEVKPKNGISWIWRSLLHGRDLLKSQGRWDVGDESDVLIATDRWLPNGELSICKVGCSLLKVNELIDQSSHSWDINVLRGNMDSNSDIQAVRTPLSITNKSDSFYWPHTSNGVYNVKSGFRCLYESVSKPMVGSSSSYAHSELSWKEIWSSKVPERVKHFIWRLKHDALATRKNMVTKRIVNSPLCPICNKEEESLEHLLFLCPWTTPV